MVDEFVKSNTRLPKVTFEGAKISHLSLSKADLIFDLKISNPNPVSISLAGFDYDFLLNGNTFVKGDNKDGLSIEANGESTVQAPVSLSFSEIYKTIRSFQKQDSAAYNVVCGFSFDLPVLGSRRVTVSKAGALPLLKRPGVKVKSLKLEKMNFTGADLNLKIEIDNPNAFTFIVNAMNYAFTVNNIEWLKGRSSQSAQIASKQSSVIELPISLNLLQMGAAISKILAGDQALSYNFSGNVDLDSSLPLLNSINLPFNKSGEVAIQK